MAISDYAGLRLLSVMILITLLWLAFMPLLRFSQEMDFRRMPDKSYLEKDWWLPRHKGDESTKIEEAEYTPMVRSDRITRWIFAIALVAGPAYGVSASDFDLWWPTAVEEWYWVAAGSVLIAFTVPTVVYAWIVSDIEEDEKEERKDDGACPSSSTGVPNKYYRGPQQTSSYEDKVIPIKNRSNKPM